MSLKVTPEFKAQCERAGVDIGVAVRLRESFPTSDMHRLLNAAIESTIEVNRKRLESCAPEELKSIQGEIRGLRTAIAIFNKQKD